MLAALPLGAASGPYLVRDLNPPHPSVPGSNPRGFVSLGSRSLFFATSDRMNYELWSTDGTTAGTQPLTFPCSVYCDTAPSGVNMILGVAEEIAFLAVREIPPGTYEANEYLWRTDGTPAGTFRLTPLSGRDYLFPNGVSGGTTILDQRLYFAHRRESGGPLELWSADVAGSGASFVANLDPGPQSVPSAIVRVGDEILLLLANLGPWSHLSLWKSDGTEGGTLFVETVSETVLGVSAALPTSEFLYFATRGPSDGDPNHWIPQLWVASGTTGGTRRLADFPDYANLSLESLRLDHDQLFFYAPAEDSTSVYQAWKSDGTAAGTYPLSAFSSLEMSYFWAEPPPITTLRGETYFLGFGSDDALALWKSEGPAGAATRVARLGEPLHFGIGFPLWLERFGGLLFFTAIGSRGWELFASDGSRAGTGESFDLCPGECSALPTRPWIDGDRMFLVGLDDSSNPQLWTLGPGELRPRQITRPPLRVGRAYFPTLADLGALPDSWLVSTADETHGFELWRIDPPSFSTSIVADLRIDRPSSYVDGFEPDGSGLFLSTSAQYQGTYPVVRTDATAEGTFVLAEAPAMQCGLFSWNSAPVLFALPDALVFEEDHCGNNRLRAWNRTADEVTTLFGGYEEPRRGEVSSLLSTDRELLFSFRDDELWDRQLWRTDGTPEGTSYLRPMPEQLYTPILFQFSDQALFAAGSPVPELHALDLATYEDRHLATFPGSLYSPDRLFGVGELAYFPVRSADGSPGPDSLLEIWRTAGTPESTFSIRTFRGGYELAGPVADLDGLALFAIRGPGESLTLWRSDGTAAGTLLVRQLGSHATPDFEFAKLGGSLYFRSADDDHGEELWRTDGTATGTGLFLDLAPGPESSGFAWLATGPRFLYLVTGTTAEERDLWISDGSPSGTHSIPLEVEPGYAPAFVFSASDGAELLFLTAASAETGLELWFVDADSRTLELVADLYPGPDSSSPQDFIEVGRSLLFTADDGVHGRELWALRDSDGAECQPDSTTLCLLGGRFVARMSGASGPAPATSLTDSTGGFSLVDDVRPDAFVKLVNGDAVNQHQWLFGAGLVGERFSLTVSDTLDGTVRRFDSSQGSLASFGEIEAFASLPSTTSTLGAAPSPTALVSGGCAPSSEQICLAGGRYAVEAAVRDFAGSPLPAHASAVDLGELDGAFWAFAPNAIDLVVRVMVHDSGASPSLAVASLTNLGYAITVTDLWTGAIAVVESPVGVFRSQAVDDLFPATP